MRKNFKRTAALAAVAAFVTACPLSTSAAGLRDVFDARHYADSYADLKEAFGYDEDALFQHYLTFGLKERRSASTVLDVLKYREAYADLNAAFGDDWDAYVNHYYTFGISENRITGLYDSSLEDTYDADDEDEDEDDEDDTPEDTPDIKPAEPVPSNPQTPSEPQAPSTEIWAESSTETGIFDYNGKPINVTITYSDVEVYEAEAEPSEGCEWQYYSVTVRTDGTPVDPEALADAISWDQSDVEILRSSHVTHDQQPWYEWFEDRWSYASTLNGVAYDGSVSIEYTHKEDTEVTAYFYVMVPQNSRLTTTVRLNADTVVKHKHK